MATTITLTGRLADITSRPIDSTVTVTVKAPAYTPGPGVEITTSQPVPVDVQNDGEVTVQVVQGVGWLYLTGDGWTDSIRFVAAEGMTTLWEAVVNALPISVDMKGYLNLLSDAKIPVEEALSVALEQVGTAVETSILGTGGATVREMVGMTEANASTDTAWAHVAATGHRLPLGYSEDGRLDDLARRVWAEDAANTYLTPSTDYTHAVATEQGHLLLGFREDGTIVAPGLAASDVGEGPQFAAREHYVHRDGTIRPTAADMTQMTTWGSSTLDYISADLSDFVGDLGVTVNDQSKGGEWIEHTAARMGAVPAVIEPVTIPASGGVNVTVSNFPALSYAMMAYNGTLAGVPGRLSATQEAITFTRSTAGDPVTLAAPTEFIPDAGPNMRDHVTLICAGKNNLSQSDTAQERVIDYTDRMFDYLTPEYPRCLILGHHANTSWIPSSATRDRLLAVNEHYRQRFGPLYIDVMGFLTSPEVWERTGIKPTQDDLDKQAIGNMPTSLARDDLHLNDAADDALAEVIRERIDYLGWY